MGENNMLEVSKEHFENLLIASGRKGIRELLIYLDEETDFYTAPASSNYHGAYEKGLLEHSLEVFEHFRLLCEIYESTLTYESIVIISLLHDVCKINFYQKTKKNQKRQNEKTGEFILNKKGLPIWDEIEYYSINDKMPLGHGEKSVIILQNYIPLLKEEIFCIRWHMMSYDDVSKSYAGDLALTNSLNLYPNISLIHCADLLSISHPIKEKELNSDDIDKIHFRSHIDLVN
jgi:hypothetical protein